MNECSLLITIISKASDKYGDLLLDFMDQYHLTNLASATVDQLSEYIERKLKDERIDNF